MFNKVKKFGLTGLVAGGVIAGGIAGLVLTYGDPSLSAQEIWRVDASNIIRIMFPVDRGINIASSTMATAALTQGGGVRATSTNDTTATLLASDFNTENLIDFTPTVQAITLSLPASSTLSSFVPLTGNTRTVFIRNATTTADSLGDVIIAGGTGTILKVATTTAAVPTIYGDTDSDNYVKLDFIRKANSDIDVFATFFND